MTGFGTIPKITAPFGINDAARIGFADPMTFERDSLYLLDGITDRHSAPGGKPFTRHHMNGIGMLATIGGFLLQAGYQTQEKNMPQGGWPKGAIVGSLVQENGELTYREFISKHDNNRVSIPWSTQYGSIEDNDWKAVWDFKNFDFFPNYNSKTEILRKTASKNSPLSATITDQRGWLLVTRTFDDWDELSERAKTDLHYAFAAELHIVVNKKVYWIDDQEFVIASNEGQKASRLIPCNGTLELSLRPESTIYGDVTVSVVKYGMEDI